MVQHDPTENSGAKVFSHQHRETGSEWESAPEIRGLTDGCLSLPHR